MMMIDLNQLWNLAGNPHKKITELVLLIGMKEALTLLCTSQKEIMTKFK